MDKTISELASELSISRQAIHQSLDNLIDKKKLNKKGNTYLLSPTQQKIIRDYFNKKDEEELSSELSSNLSTQLITTLQSQNELLNKEIENKNKQISELHILLLKEKENNILLISAKESEIEETTKKLKEEYDRTSVQIEQKKKIVIILTVIFLTIIGIIIASWFVRHF